MTEIVRATYIPSLHIVPGQLELMEFEHETPKALLTREGKDSLFFARLGEAIAQVSDAYDVVVIDCPPQLGFLTLSALCAATAVLITVHPQMLDVMSMSQFLNMTGSLLDVVAKAGGDNHMIGCAIWSLDTSRAMVPDDDGRLDALYLWIASADSSDGQKYRYRRRRPHQADALRGRASAVYARHL